MADDDFDGASDDGSEYHVDDNPERTKNGTYLSQGEARAACQAEHFIYAQSFGKLKPGSYFANAVVGSSLPCPGRSPLLSLHVRTHLFLLSSHLRPATAPPSARR